jgi:hypothetical protein
MAPFQVKNPSPAVVIAEPAQRSALLNGHAVSVPQANNGVVTQPLAPPTEVIAVPLQEAPIVRRRNQDEFIQLMANTRNALRQGRGLNDLPSTPHTVVVPPAGGAPNTTFTHPVNVVEPTGTLPPPATNLPPSTNLPPPTTTLPPPVQTNPIEVTDIFDLVPKGLMVFRGVGMQRQPSATEFEAMKAIAEEFRASDSGLAWVTMRDNKPAVYLKVDASAADVAAIKASIQRNFNVSASQADDFIYRPRPEVYDTK